MDDNIIHIKCSDFQNHKHNSYIALKFIVSLFVCDIYPFMKSIVKGLQKCKEKGLEDTFAKNRTVFILCSDQMKKCFNNFLDVLKIENKRIICIQESRQCILERISWCFQKLLTIEEQLNTAMNIGDNVHEHSTDSILLESMYFVNWVDHTFDILGQLLSLVYKTNWKNPELLERKEELVECVRGLHTSVDELLLSAMTIWKYCLPSDQVVVKARCQVVLRETKVLLSDLIIGDLDSIVEATKENVKLPINPLNVNVLIDVLKDVLYALETNTNTALLALVVHSFGHSVSPADMLKKHLESEACTCGTDTENVDEECMFVKSFDLYNERLMQIATFAMSCSCDEKRILCLRSGLASLEALDPHLVPALMLSPTGPHARVLADVWHQEVRQIRDNVFLIVDPSAFVEKAKQMMHQNLLQIMKDECYDNHKTCAVIDVGRLVLEFFGVYRQNEPDALPQLETLRGLLDNLNKAQMECKIVSNSLCSENDFVYDIKKKQIDVTLDKLVKRLKLLYTLVKRIYFILNPKDDDDDDFYNEEPMEMKNNTYTLITKNQKTYVNSPRVANNMTRSIFARSNYIRSTPGKLPLAVLTKHLKTKRDLSFSVKLDEMCNLSEIKKPREHSILYHPNATTRSLRKAVLNKHLLAEQKLIDEEILNGTESSERNSLMDENMSLQITDVLNQLNDLTTCVPTPRRQLNATYRQTDDRSSGRRSGVGDISACRTADVTSPLDVSLTSPSDVDTLERISDLELVESKLSNLRLGHIETSL